MSSTLRPGDLTVSPMRGGFLIGRVLPERGPGPWWAFIETCSTLYDAIESARRQAVLGHTRAWMQIDGGDYREIPLDQDFSLL